MSLQQYDPNNIHTYLSISRLGSQFIFLVRKRQALPHQTLLFFLQLISVRFIIIRNEIGTVRLKNNIRTIVTIVLELFELFFIYQLFCKFCWNAANARLTPIVKSSLKFTTNKIKFICNDELVIQTSYNLKTSIGIRTVNKRTTTASSNHYTTPAR